MPNNKQFERDPGFIWACGQVEVKPSARQYGKFKKGAGEVWAWVYEKQGRITYLNNVYKKAAKKAQGEMFHGGNSGKGAE